MHKTLIPVIKRLNFALVHCQHEIDILRKEVLETMGEGQYRNDNRYKFAPKSVLIKRFHIERI